MTLRSVLQAACLPLAACTVPVAEPYAGPEAGLPRTEVEARAQDSRLPPPPPPGEPIDLDLAIENGERLDHATKLLALRCSVGEIESKLRAPVLSYLEARDRNGSLDIADADRIIVIDRVRTLGRSYSSTTFESEARFDVELHATLRMSGGETEDISFAVSLTGAGGMMNCSSIGRALSIVNLHVASRLSDAATAGRAL